MLWKSHFFFSEAVMEALHADGHQITMISPFPSKKNLTNFTHVDSRFDSIIFVDQPTLNDSDSMSWNSMMEAATSLVVEGCQNIMKLSKIQVSFKIDTLFKNVYSYLPFI